MNGLAAYLAAGIIMSGALQNHLSESCVGKLSFSNSATTAIFWPSVAIAKTIGHQDADYQRAAAKAFIRKWAPWANIWNKLWQ